MLAGSARHQPIIGQNFLAVGIQPLHQVQPVPSRM